MAGSYSYRWLSRLAVVAAAVGTAWPAAAGPWRRHTIDNSYFGADGARPEFGEFHARPDLAAVWEQSGITTLLSWPEPALVACEWPHIVVGATPAAEDAFAIDLDGDGDRDVVVCMEGSVRRVSFFESTAEGFQEHVVPLDPYKWMIAEPVDLDHDGRVDVVTGGRFVDGDQGQLAWLKPGPEPTAIDQWTSQPIAPVGWPMAILALDMDDDGDDDLVIADRYGATRGLRWLENPHPAVSKGPWVAHTIGLTNRRVVAAAATDLDNDGSIDFVAAYQGVNNVPPGLVILMGGAAGWSESQVPLPAPFPAPKSVKLDDFNDDGLLDIALSCEQAYKELSGVFVFMQEASGGWRLVDVSGPEGTKFDVLTALDVDGDGDLDLITTEEGDNGLFAALGVVWYENPLRRTPSLIGSTIPLEPELCEEIPAAWLIELSRLLSGTTPQSVTPPSRR